DAHHQQRVGDRVEVHPQQECNEGKTEGHYDLQPCNSVLQVAELTHPLQSRARRQHHLLGNLALRLLNGTAQIAVAYAELDGQVSLQLLAVDIGRSGNQLDRGHLPQGDLRHAIRTLHAYAEIGDGFGALPILRRKPHHNRKMSVAAGFEQVARAVPTRSEEHTSELQSQSNLVCRLLLE